MNGLLDGRLALITGAGSGIGAAIAHAMANAGARVVAADIDGAAVQRTATAIGSKASSFA
jgi:NAD(P)-dependent dehydrogenase (short-subunit alcohol dehydrogenase family)